MKRGASTAVSVRSRLMAHRAVAIPARYFNCSSARCGVTLFRGAALLCNGPSRLRRYLAPQPRLHLRSSPSRTFARRETPQAVLRSSNHEEVWKDVASWSHQWRSAWTWSRSISSPQSRSFVLSRAAVSKSSFTKSPTRVYNIHHQADPGYQLN